MQCTCDKHGCIWKDTGNSCSSHNPRTSQAQDANGFVESNSIKSLDIEDLLAPRPRT